MNALFDLRPRSVDGGFFINVAVNQSACGYFHFLVSIHAFRWLLKYLPEAAVIQSYMMDPAHNTEKAAPEHDEIRFHQAADATIAAAGAIDQETAEYAGAVATPIDPATNKRLFWTINRRILLCMLGVRGKTVLGDLLRCL